MNYHRWEIETRDGAVLHGEDTFPCDALKALAKRLSIEFPDDTTDAVKVPAGHRAVLFRKVRVEVHIGENGVVQQEAHAPNYHADYHIGSEDARGKRTEHMIMMRKGARVVDA